MSTEIENEITKLALESVLYCAKAKGLDAAALAKAAADHALSSSNSNSGLSAENKNKVREVLDQALESIKHHH